MNDDEYDGTYDDDDNENHDYDDGGDDDYGDDIHEPHEGDLASTFPPTPELERITYYPNYPGDRHCHLCKHCHHHRQCHHCLHCSFTSTSSIFN